MSKTRGIYSWLSKSVTSQWLSSVTPSITMGSERDNTNTLPVSILNPSFSIWSKSNSLGLCILISSEINPKSTLTQNCTTLCFHLTQNSPHKKWKPQISYNQETTDLLITKFWAMIKSRSNSLKLLVTLKTNSVTISLSISFLLQTKWSMSTAKVSVPQLSLRMLKTLNDTVYFHWERSWKNQTQIIKSLSNTGLRKATPFPTLQSRLCTEIRRTKLSKSTTDRLRWLLFGDKFKKLRISLELKSVEGCYLFLLFVYSLFV